MKSPKSNKANSVFDGDDNTMYCEDYAKAPFSKEAG